MEAHPEETLQAKLIQAATYGNDLLKRNAQLTAELAETKKEHEETVGELNATIEHLTELRNSAAAEADSVKKHLAELEALVYASVKQREDLRASALDAQQEHERAKAKHVEESRKLNRENQQLHSLVADLQTEIAKEKAKNAELMNALREAKGEVQELKSPKKDSVADKEKGVANIEPFLSDIASLKELPPMQRRLSQQNIALSADLQEVRKGQEEIAARMRGLTEVNERVHKERFEMQLLLEEARREATDLRIKLDEAETLLATGGQSSLPRMMTPLVEYVAKNEENIVGLVVHATGYESAGAESVPAAEVLAGIAAAARAQAQLLLLRAAAPPGISLYSLNPDRSSVAFSLGSPYNSQPNTPSTQQTDARLESLISKLLEAETKLKQSKVVAAASMSPQAEENVKNLQTSLTVTQAQLEGTEKELKKLQQDQPLEGWLTKKGDIINAWRRRWFFLYSGNKLHYSEAPTKPLRGIIDLNGAYLQLDTARQTGKDWAFILHCMSGRSYYLFADTKQEMDNWVKRIRERINMTRVDPTHIPIPIPAAPSSRSSAATWSPPQGT